MKLECDVQFVKGAKGILHLRPVDKHLNRVKSFMASQAENKKVRLVITDRESKTVQQCKTFHLLWDIYWKSGLSSDLTKRKMRDRLKYEHGTTEFFEASDGTVIATLKSVADYNIKEGRNLIDGTISEMLLNGVQDKRFQDMIEEFNSDNNNKNN